MNRYIFKLDFNFSAQTAQDEGAQSTKSSSASSSDCSDPEARQRAKECEAETKAWEQKHGHPVWIDCGEGCPDESDEEGRKPAQEELPEEDEQQPEDFENGASDSDGTPPLVIDEDQVQGNGERNREAD